MKKFKLQRGLFNDIRQSLFELRKTKFDFNNFATEKFVSIRQVELFLITLYFDVNTDVDKNKLKGE